MNTYNFADKLKTERLHRRLTQQQVADGIGISRASYVGYEKGKSIPSTDILQKLSHYYNVTIDYLINNSLYGTDEQIENAFKNVLDVGIQTRLLLNLLNREGLPILYNGIRMNSYQIKTTTAILNALDQIMNHHEKGIGKEQE